MAEHQLETKDKYVWKDELRGRIDKTTGKASINLHKCPSECLAQSGIINEIRKNVSYNLLGIKEKHRRVHGKTLSSYYEKKTILDELELRQKPAAPNIHHLRSYSREAEASYLSSRQKSDENSKD